MRFRVAITGLCILPLFAACDTKPKANFEEELKATRERRNQGDKFESLNQHAGRLGRYLGASKDSKAAQLATSAIGATDAVRQALGTLKALPAPADGRPVVDRCRAAIEAAIAFRNPSSDGMVSEGDALFADLTACRAAARAQEEMAHGDARTFYEGWKRTASTAMMVVGATLVERGETTKGVDLWRQADLAMSADRPAYKVKITDFNFNPGR